MKKLILFLVVLCAVQKASSQFVMDSPFIGDRFLVYNGLVNYKIWSVPEFLMHHPEQFKLNDAERLQLIKAKYEFYPSNYLFHEENFWTKRVFKTIVIAENKGIVKLLSVSDSIQLNDFVLKNMNDPKLDVFADSTFMNLVHPHQVDSNFIKNSNCIEIKEDWYYNKSTNQMEVFILGLGLGIQTGKQKTIKYWLYYPQLKNKILVNYPKSEIISKLKNRNYFVSDTRIQGNSYGGMLLDLEYQNDWDAVLQAVLLQDELKLYASSISANGKFSLLLKSENSVLKGNLIDGKLEGKLEKISSDGKLMLLFTFSKGELNGGFQLNYRNGKTKQIGNMLAGAPEGEVLSYYAKGNLLSKKNYSGGFLDGVQIQYYENQNIKCKYLFSEAMLNGNFESFYPDGSLREKGEVSNGLLVGTWQYRIEMPEYIKKIMLRNPSYFNQNYLFVREWKAEKLQTKYLEFKAIYTLSKSDDCLNKLCSNVEIIEQ